MSSSQNLFYKKAYSVLFEGSRYCAMGYPSVLWVISVPTLWVTTAQNYKSEVTCSTSVLHRIVSQLTRSIFLLHRIVSHISPAANLCGTGLWVRAHF